MNLTLIVGTRPNFMKIAPIIHAIVKVQEGGSNIHYRLVHTGQHYDEKMSNSFFKELNIPTPDVNLGCGGGTQAEQTAAIMVAFEKELLANPADLVMVVGDVTSTMACSIVAKKLNTKLAHVEAGLRSWDLTMFEEINRMVTDALADYFFTTTELANENLRKTGVSDDKIFFVGNVMIDTLLANRHRFKTPRVWDEQKLVKGNYIVMTLHRPANVDEEKHFKSLLEAIIESSQGIPIVFPVHPRTAKIIQSLNLSVSSSLRPSVSQSPRPSVSSSLRPSVSQSLRPSVSSSLSPSVSSSLTLSVSQSLHLIEPLGYLEFNYLVENAKAVITDSGGITEETTVLGIPCITIRNSTERPETITIGTNELIGTNPAVIKPALDKLFAGKWKRGGIPELWDGKAAERIVYNLVKLYDK